MKNLYIKSNLSIFVALLFSTVSLAQSGVNWRRRVRMVKQLVFICFAVFSVMTYSHSVAAQTTAFSYQGSLTNAGSPANSNFDFQFALFSALTGGTQLGSTQTVSNLAVTNGIFSATLDFGSQFPGANRFLEIRVRTAGGGGFTTLTPRQPVSSAPYAVKSLSSDSAANATQLGGVTAANYLQTNGNGSGLTNLNGANITNNTINASALAPGTLPSQQNLALLGSLRWDLLQPRNFAVGTGPQGATFDGTNIWVANRSSNNVTKLRASDGALQGTFAVGESPFGIDFDGANIWVSNAGSNNVTKLRASDGVALGTFAVGTDPIGVAFDGANIWVANANNNNVTKLRASDGAVQGTFVVGTGPNGVAFDGANIWVTNNASNNVIKLRASDGAVQGTFTVGTGPRGVAFDGTNIWVTNGNSNTVTKLRASDGAVQGTFVAGTFPFGIAFDGANIWVSNITSNTVTKLSASDGAVQGTFAVGNGLRGIAFDGANIWVSNNNSDTVTKLPAFP